MSRSEIVEFIRHVYETNDPIALHEPTFAGNEKAYLTDCIDSTFVSSVGPYVDQFESRMAQIAHTRSGVAVVNGTEALHIALKISGVNSSDLVITQALSFVATANAIAYCGASPLFLDVDPLNLCLSPRCLLKFLQEETELKEGERFYRNQRIAACVPVHVFGHMGSAVELAEICKNFGIPLIEDATEALGSTLGDRPAGSFGTLGVFSFNGNKIVTAGGGGAITTNDTSLAKTAKHLTTTAKVPHPWEYHHDQLGYNYRMPNINAALACAQLEQLPAFVSLKRRLAGVYAEFFRRSSTRFIQESEGSQSNYWLNAIVLSDRHERDEMLKLLNNAGISARPCWQLLHRLPMYKDCPRQPLGQAEFFEDRIVNIPSGIPKHWIRSNRGI